MTSDEPPCEDLVREQLERLARSAVFARSARLLLFLRFVVEETLAGRGGSLKELVVGDRLYSAHAPYDPRIDSAVRVGAREIRRKLARHYKGPGASDRVRIDMPAGSYRPIFSMNYLHHHQPRDDTSTGARFSLSLPVRPVLVPTRSDESERRAGDAPREIVLTLDAGLHLDRIPGVLLFRLGDRTYALCEAFGDFAVPTPSSNENDPGPRPAVELAEGGVGSHTSPRIDQRGFETIVLRVRPPSVT